MLERMDTFIYDLHSGRLEDLEFGIKALTRSPLETEKTVIVITSILSWGETEHKLIEDIPEPQLDEDGNPIVQKISDADWNALKDEINKLDLENLTNLKAPTEKRFYDGAAIANLKIIYNGKIYQSSDFDHGFPPMQIKRVVEMINLLFKPEV